MALVKTSEMLLMIWSLISDPEHLIELTSVKEAIWPNLYVILKSCEASSWSKTLDKWHELLLTDFCAEQESSTVREIVCVYTEHHVFQRHRTGMHKKMRAALDSLFCHPLSAWASDLRSQRLPEGARGQAGGCQRCTDAHILRGAQLYLDGAAQLQGATTTHALGPAGTWGRTTTRFACSLLFVGNM